MTERAERPARLAARRPIGHKSQIAANARPPAPLCGRPHPQRGPLRVGIRAENVRDRCWMQSAVGPIVHQAGPSGRHLRSHQDHYQESRLTPGSQSPRATRDKKKNRRSPGTGASLRPGDISACHKIAGYGVLPCPRGLEHANAGSLPGSGKSCHSYTSHHAVQTEDIPRVHASSRNLALPADRLTLTAAYRSYACAAEETLLTYCG